jgi:hypothetical protein
MAQLPGGDWLIQQTDGVVRLFHRYTEELIVEFEAGYDDAVAKAQATIHASDRLTEEQKCFAHFWSGYFYAHATAATMVTR